MNVSRVTALLVAGLSVSTLAAEPANSLNKCTIGGVSLKSTFKFVMKRCLVFQEEAKFRETLEQMGWDMNALPSVDWSKEAAVVEAGERPYPKAEAACVGVYGDAKQQKATFRWAWQERAAATAAEPAPAEGKPSTDKKPMGEQMKDSVKAVGQDVVKTGKQIAQDFKQFPNPLPKRQAVIATFPKALLAHGVKMECSVQK
jgi:hypothetical protein